jgi:hypothetical protein
MRFNKEKSYFVVYLMTAGMIIVLSRTVSSFVPQTNRLSSLRVSSPNARRRSYYNSEWINRRTRIASIIPTPRHAAEHPEDAGSAVSRASAADQEEDPLAEYRNKNNINDQVVSFISGQGGIKVGKYPSCLLLRFLPVSGS